MLDSIGGDYCNAYSAHSEIVALNTPTRFSRFSPEMFLFQLKFLASEDALQSRRVTAKTRENAALVVGCS